MYSVGSLKPESVSKASCVGVTENSPTGSIFFLPYDIGQALCLLNKDLAIFFTISFKSIPHLMCLALCVTCSSQDSSRKASHQLL